MGVGTDHATACGRHRWFDRSGWQVNTDGERQGFWPFRPPWGGTRDPAQAAACGGSGWPAEARWWKCEARGCGMEGAAVPNDWSGAVWC